MPQRFDSVNFGESQNNNWGISEQRQDLNDIEKQLSPEAKKAIIETFNYRDFGHSIDKTLAEFNLSVDVLNSPELREVAAKVVQDKLLHFFDDHYFGGLNFANAVAPLDIALAIKEKFNFSADELKNDQEFQEKARKTMLEMVKDGSLGIAEEIRMGVDFPNEVYFSPEFQEIAAKKSKEFLVRFLEYGGNDYIKELNILQQRFGIALEGAKDDQEIIRKMSEKIRDGKEESVEKVRNLIFGDDREIYSTPKFRNAGKGAIIQILGKGYNFDIDHLNKIYSTVFGDDREILNDPEIQKAAKDAIKYQLSVCIDRSDFKGENYVIAGKLKEKFNIAIGEAEADADLQNLAKDRMLLKIERGEIDKMEEIADNLNISKEIYNSPEFKKEAENQFNQNLLKYVGGRGTGNGFYFERAILIGDFFKISIENSLDAQTLEQAELAMLSMVLEGKFDEMEKIRIFLEVPMEIYKSHKFQQAALKKADSILTMYINFCSSDNLRELPFLEEMFGISIESIKNNSGIQQTAIKKIFHNFSTGSFNSAEEIRAFIFGDDKKIYSLPEFKNAAKQSIIRLFEIDSNVDMNRLISIVSIVFEDAGEAFADLAIQDVAKNYIFKFLRKGWVGQIPEIAKMIFGPTKEKGLYGLPEFRVAALEGVATKFEYGDTETIEAMQKEFLPDLDLASFLKEKYALLIEQGKWNLVVRIGSGMADFRKIYDEFLTKQKAIAENGDSPMIERRKAFDVLAGLVENGEPSINGEFAEIIKNRSKQKEVPDSKWGLDPVQEAAFYTLKRLDNSDSNEALFGLSLSENVNPAIKHIIIKKLAKSSITNDFVRDGLQQWLARKPVSKIDWNDLQFIAAIDKIPSKELQAMAVHSLYFMNDSFFDDSSLSSFWSEKYKDIPQNVFLQTMNLCVAAGNKNIELLDKFQILFANIKKENTKKNNLLYGITNALEADPRLVEILSEKLAGIDFGSKLDADSLSEFLRQVAFLSKIEKIKNTRIDDEADDNYESEDNERQTQKENLPQDVLAIFSKEVGSFDELNLLVREYINKQIQEILPDDRITAEKINLIEEKWGDLEPIFTYLGRFPESKDYIAEIVAHLDSEENWKNWRYNIGDEEVFGQIGYLSEQQLEIWKEDHFIDLGEVMLAETGANKPERIQNILETAIVQHKHIFNPGMGQIDNEFVQNELESVFGQIAQNFGQKKEIINSKIEEIRFGAKNIDAIIEFGNLPKLNQFLKFFQQGKEISPSAKIKSGINLLINYLPEDLREILFGNYADLEKNGKMDVDQLFTAQMREAVEAKIAEIEKNRAISLESNIWGKINLDKTNDKNQGQFHAKRRELQSAIDLLKLCNLDNRMIAANEIAAKAGKKHGETIIKTLSRLKSQFKNSPLAQDLENIEFALKEKSDFGEKRKLAMIFTDNPQILWQVGKYPLGCGSCQHYAEGSHDYACKLLGYVGDPNCKVVYLVDLNKLPQDDKDKIAGIGFAEAKNTISSQSLLNASVARAIIKMGKSKNNKPAILIEPTYTVINKGDESMDNYFNNFINLMVAQPMGAKMGRAGGEESITIGNSINVEGQYEDCDLDKIKFIN